MKISQKNINFLEKEKVSYNVISHKVVYTAFDKASTLKIKLDLIAKSIVLKGDNLFFITIISGNRNIDKEKFKKVLNIIRKKEGEKIIKKIDFASEKWIKNYFKGTKIGAIPPFGKLYKLPVFIDKLILKNKKIYFSSENYQNSFLMSPKEFFKTADRIFEGNFSVIKKTKKAKKAKKVVEKKSEKNKQSKIKKTITPKKNKRKKITIKKKK